MGMEHQHKRTAKTRWVALGKMIASPQSQRKLKQSWADALAVDFDIEVMGRPVLHDNKDGTFSILDGQHRIAALKKWFGEGWETQQIQCDVYEGMTEAEQCDLFLELNNFKSPRPFDKFRIAVNAGREEEVDIYNVLVENGLVLSHSKGDGHVRAVGALKKVYQRSGRRVLGKALRIIRDAFGDHAFGSAMIDGIGWLCHRYGRDLDEQRAIAALNAVNGGPNGLIAKAEVLRKQTGSHKALCIAAAAVEVINKGRGGKKLPSWWKQ